MSNLEQPDDLFIDLITWLGLPGVVVSVFMLIFWGMGWRDAVLSARKAAISAGNYVKGRTPATTRLSVALVVAQTLVLAISYSISQLLPLMFKTDRNGRNLSDGMLYQMDDVYQSILEYNHWTAASRTTVILGLIAILIVNLAGLLNSRFLWLIVKAAAIPLMLAAGGLAALSFIGGCAVLSLGLSDSDGYTPDMSILYGIWFALLAGFVLAASWINSSFYHLFVTNWP